MNRISATLGLSILVYASAVGLAQSPRHEAESAATSEAKGSFDQDRDH